MAQFTLGEFIEFAHDVCGRYRYDSWLTFISEEFSDGEFPKDKNHKVDISWQQNQNGWIDVEIYDGGSDKLQIGVLESKIFEAFDLYDHKLIINWIFYDQNDELLIETDDLYADGIRYKINWEPEEEFRLEY